jgi:hypothetical protein
VTKQKIEISVLVGLLVVGALVYFFNRSQIAGGMPRVSADAKFVPLSVQEPQLRIDLLAKLQKEESLSAHRNIFNATPPPPEPTKAELYAQNHKYATGPVPPAPPPPVQVPGEFFGYAVRPAPSGARFGFFKNGDDVLVVAEGDKFLSNYRLIHIGNDSADVEEISSGRHARVAMVQPPASGGAGAGPAPGDQATP